MAEEHLDTQNPVQVAIDEAGGKAQGTVQWLLEDKASLEGHPITQGNKLEFFICGEEGFKQIYQDLKEAESTVDLVCWGFDPGMELGSVATVIKIGSVSNSVSSDIDTRMPGTWPRGITYGELLEDITSSNRKDGKKAVTVRLLVWYNKLASAMSNSMPGYTDRQDWNLNPVNNIANLVGSATPYASTARHQYCVQWWQNHVPHGRSGPSKTHPNLKIVLRDTSAADTDWGLSDEEDKPGGHWPFLSSEYWILKLFATHHQKPILIDYEYEEGRKAVGYVMGLNSVTDYWDTSTHQVESKLREQAVEGKWQAEIQHEYIGQFDNEQRNEEDMPTADDWEGKTRMVSGGQYRSTKPYQDYACRIVGPALEGVHANFVQGWNDATPPADWSAQRLPALPPNIPKGPEDPACQVQIVRTQPHRQDKTIKQLYYQATSIARNYIYIENQYFFYPDFARNLIEERQKFCKAWAAVSNKPMQAVPPLHLFIVIPHPEENGMMPRTAQMLAELGQGNTTPKQSNGPVVDRESVKKLMATLGLKVSVATLRTSVTDGTVKGVAPGQLAYREIYIHSKLMLIDDVFVTLGSANLNQRSMAVDSEINVAATGQAWASGLRERIFTLHSGGTIKGSGVRGEIPEVFDDWERQMNKNLDIKMEGTQSLTGFLLPFVDQRKSLFKVAKVDLPGSGNTVPV